MIRGGLFTQFFLSEGIGDTPEWAVLDDAALDARAAELKASFDKFPIGGKPSEATTEHDLIFPIVKALGWEYLPQVTVGEGKDRERPDALLFVSADAKAQANRKKNEADRYPFACVVQENKAWRIGLDRATAGEGSAPASQMLRYLRRADTFSEGAIRWGVLTNGRLWRLYSTRARSRAEGYLEVDLAEALGAVKSEATSDDRRRALKIFLLFFRQGAFVPTGPSSASFLDVALDRGRRYEEKVTADLSRAVFDRIFPRLVTALAEGDKDRKPDDSAWRLAVKDSALILLYRLLFILYAEDRDLLPVDHDYSLRGIRDEVAKKTDAGEAFSERASAYWHRMRALFAAIESGDPALGLPPYNGGLFAESSAPYLARAALPDTAFAALIDDLSRTGPEGARLYVNYRDLSVQQLGAIYEQLLEYDVIARDGTLAIAPNPFARKTSGSYYTPEELVALIIRRAVGPLIAERVAAFGEKAQALAKERRPKADRLRELAPLDPAARFLELKVCDPAMGSGHFLVSLVDYLADETLAAMAEAEDLVPWVDADNPYRSSLAVSIAAIRKHIEAEAKKHGWKVAPAQLDDRHIVRRIVLKRVVYGVDLNPMAVELAKLSLWLHSFTVGAPLSFLDHHLRCGDSLFGEWVYPVEVELEASGALFIKPSVAAARQSAKGMAMVEQMTDADIAEVKSSAATFHGVEEATGPLRQFLDIIHAARWLKPMTTADVSSFRYLTDGVFGDPVKVAAGTAEPKGPAELRENLGRFLARVRALAGERRFMHWEPSFPGVWENWESAVPNGGFDAVIGNPPWDRIKLQEVEWFAARVPEIAKSQRASDRTKMIKTLKGASIATDFERAAWVAEAATRVARDGGKHPQYPLLSSGDINIYSLFVERALHIVNPDGIVGLLTPSGIAADKGASEFFRTISTTGRLGALFDFENRRTTLDLEPFFPDVDSRFKFSALVIGGPRRTFPAASCAFFQQDAVAAERDAFPLAPVDFTAVNPNTGTAPVFRTRRDADLTTAVYRRLPVLVDRRVAPPVSVWPVRYCTMFHMTNDSALFRSAAELEKDGAYRVSPHVWKKGRAEWVPLYEGKMVQAFDHRAASVTVNPNNVHRPAQPAPTTKAQHTNPEWLPEPQFWVSSGEVYLPEGLEWSIGFKDIASPTNMRTMIASIVPFAAYGNKLPLLLPILPEEPANRRGEKFEQWQEEVAAALADYRRYAPLLLSNLDSFALDYVARQKVQGTSLNLYIVEQLPLVPLEGFVRKIGRKSAEAIVREEVLRLTYTATDMAAFARDMGYDGKPFSWDEDARRHARARLDALFFLLYGLDREASDYMLSTFPIVREQDEKEFGHYLTRDLVLGYMAAFEAGDTESRIAASSNDPVKISRRRS
jgi:hypothetical protein